MKGIPRSEGRTGYEKISQLNGPEFPKVCQKWHWSAQFQFRQKGKISGSSNCEKSIDKRSLLWVGVDISLFYNPLVNIWCNLTSPGMPTPKEMYAILNSLVASGALTIDSLFDYATRYEAAHTDSTADREVRADAPRSERGPESTPRSDDVFQGKSPR